MKKAIILVLFLVGVISAQVEVDQNTLDLKDKYGRSLSPDIKINPSDSKPYYNNFTITKADSLVGADTVTYNFNNYALFGEINLYNAGADADTLIIEYYDMFNSRWTSSMNGLLENLTNDPVADNTSIIIANAVSKRYRINEPYPGQVRLRTKVTTGQASDKVYVGFIGKN